jgi:hypothetical protein
MKIASLNGKLAWAIVGFYITKNKSFKSVSGNSYEAKLLKNSIQYTGNNRNEGMPETINEEEFVSAFDSIITIGDINTNTIRNLLPSILYRKRTPFIGLLVSSGILE